MKKLLQEIDQLQQEINTYRPLDQYTRAQIKEYFRIGLTYASNALEGNTLTESETKVVLEEGITVGGKPLIDHLEAIGHSDAYNFMYECVQNRSFTQDDMKELHRLFYYRIDEKQAGIYRTSKVYITGSKYALPSPEQVPMLMNHFTEALHDLKRTEHPVICAAQAHKKFVYIHPFIDGNGRVARLLMNLILLQYGYTIAIVPPVLRADYIHALEKGREDDTPFVELIMRMVKETQKDYLRLFV